MQANFVVDQLTYGQHQHLYYINKDFHRKGFGKKQTPPSNFIPFKDLTL